VPARLTAALAAALAPLVGGSPEAALRTWRRDGHRHPSPNAGPCEAAFAGALGISLGGENRYPAPGAPGGVRVEVRGPLGDGPPPGPDDVDRAARLSAAVGVAAAVLCALPHLRRTAAPRDLSTRPVGAGAVDRAHRGTARRRAVPA
jgi:adenosylcobinamide-phosphate synthase